MSNQKRVSCQTNGGEGASAAAIERTKIDKKTNGMTNGVEAAESPENKICLDP